MFFETKSVCAVVVFSSHIVLVKFVGDFGNNFENQYGQSGCCMIK